MMLRDQKFKEWWDTQEMGAYNHADITHAMLRLMRVVAVGIRGGDFHCEECDQLAGSTLDNGWYRCNACGYPSK